MFYGLRCEERMLQNQTSECPTVPRKYNWHPTYPKFLKQRSTVNSDHAKSLVPPDLKITPFTNSLLERLSNDSYSSEEWKLQNLFIVTHCPVGKSSLIGPSGQSSDCEPHSRTLSALYTRPVWEKAICKSVLLLENPKKAPSFLLTLE